MTAPVLPKTISKKRREWLRGLKVGDQVAMWDGYSWSDAIIDMDHGNGSRTFRVKAMNNYPSAWVSKTSGVEISGGALQVYIGPKENHLREVEVDEAKHAIRNAPFAFDGITDEAIVEAAKILRAGKRAS